MALTNNTQIPTEHLNDQEQTKIKEYLFLAHDAMERMADALQQPQDCDVNWIYCKNQAEIALNYLKAVYAQSLRGIIKF